MKTHCSYLLISLSILGLTYLGACREKNERDLQERTTQPVKSSVEISLEDGITVLTIDTATQNRLGLAISPLPVSTTRHEVVAPGMVLSAQDLTNSRNSYVAAEAQLQKSRIEVDVASKEFSRLKTLFDENQNVSEKALQSADGALQASRVDLHAAEQQVTLQQSLMQQQWGRNVAAWGAEDSPEYRRLLDQSEVLVQITVPATATFVLPKTVSVEVPGGMRAQGSLVSPLPRIDPRIQGNSLLYLVPAHSALAPGLSLLTHISVGQAIRGVIVPASAIVWSEGKAWAYQQTSPDRFSRRTVPTDAPVEKGFFVAAGLTAGTKIVIQGAQALLSEELLSNNQQGAEPDVD